VALARARLREVCSEERIQAIDAEVERTMEEAVAFAQASPEPDLQQFLSEIER